MAGGASTLWMILIHLPPRIPSAMSRATRAASFLGLLAPGFPALSFPQTANPAAPPVTQNEPAGEGGGVNTGPPQPAQYDEDRRPITAGGFVANGPVIFKDISEKAGLNHWTHKMGAKEKKYIVETNRSGVCLIDCDNDGWKDLMMADGHVYP